MVTTTFLGAEPVWRKTSYCFVFTESFSNHFIVDNFVYTIWTGSLSEEGQDGQIHMTNLWIATKPHILRKLSQCSYTIDKDLIRMREAEIKRQI